MRILKTAALGLALLGLAAGSAARADALDTIKSKGVLTVGVVIDPPFGIKNKDGTLSGYDVDFAIAIAKRLGVKPVVLELEAEDRVAALNNRKIDILTAYTKTAEREKQVSFSYGYFVTGQKFVARVGKIKTLDDAKPLAIGAVRATTSEKQAKQELPGTSIISFVDIDEAFRFLQQGKIDAVTYDEPILAAKLLTMPGRQQFEISPVSVSTKAYGLAVFKGEKRLVGVINDTLSDMERSGDAERVFNRWFGPNSTAPLPRIFKIQS
ncbi:transporter substrate-binding domain-containing protein [Chitinimonas koreensis]|uniref:transporter substrate-binding domain-containing protein n=1 Tax=Chitinimonas koreensis TaxID=356302 RepID=UPI0003FE7F53|nr:transporter substrate-binding domain-containing protein [Chitinimonas koreensis]QNM95424.1 transporter substrate-binding domain-containing protein [Chitinimonas koreensis]